MNKILSNFKMASYSELKINLLTKISTLNTYLGLNNADKCNNNISNKKNYVIYDGYDYNEMVFLYNMGTLLDFIIENKTIPLRNENSSRELLCFMDEIRYLYNNKELPSIICNRYYELFVIEIYNAIINGII